MHDLIDHNAQALRTELDWLKELIKHRLNLFFKKECPYESIVEIEPPDHDPELSTYGLFIAQYELNIAERLVLILGLAPHIAPETLDGFCIKNLTYEKPFSEFGGIDSTDHPGFLPTGETALFLLSDQGLTARFHLQYVFDTEHLFCAADVIKLETAGKNRPLLSGQLTVSQDYVDYFTIGRLRKPDLSSDFPARRVATNLEWEDVVLKPHTKNQVMEIKDWIEYGHILLNGWGLSGKIKPGYRSLFYGSSGTGKTLTACLLGKYTNKDVYRIDLSMVVSKYIGETEKNLARVFDKAAHRGWILFFDEAEALFGKRGETKDAHDRHANQEVAYLLQRIEDYPGLVILATNLKENMDAAFTRRFQSIIHFPTPGPEERLKLWEKAFSPRSELEDKIDLKALAKKHNISGALIMNAVQHASIKTLKRDSNVISLTDLEGGIKKELIKEGVSL